MVEHVTYTLTSYCTSYLNLLIVYLEQFLFSKFRNTFIFHSIFFQSTLNFFSSAIEKSIIFPMVPTRFRSVTRELYVHSSLTIKPLITLIVFFHPIEVAGGFNCPAPEEVPAAGSFSRHAHPDDCRKYFICLDKTPREYGCPIGTVFKIGDAEGTGSCEDPEDVPGW